MAPPDPSDEAGVLMAKLKHAFQTYESASKKYLSAVKDLDASMEGIAIAFRELAQGEPKEKARAAADRFCCAIDAHKSGSLSKKNDKAPVAPMSDENYHFSTYMSDFVREVTNGINDLKDEMKRVEKFQKKRDHVAKEYNEYRISVDKKEAQLAKKNRGIADDPKYAKKVIKRDKYKTVVEEEERRFQGEFHKLIDMRSNTLGNIVSAMSLYSSRYYSGLSKVLAAGQ